MKKIPTLFERVFDGHKIVGITPKVHDGMEWVLQGGGVATEKIDGACCAFFDGKFYKRYDAKKGKKPPEGAIPCCDPDPITGHHPHWVEIDPSKPEDKWFVKAFENANLHATGRIDYSIGRDLYGTYEAIGVHFQGNPYGLSDDIVEKHGERYIEVERTFEGIKQYLTDNYIEGIVFWKDGEPQCKIKRSDFGLKWGAK